MTGRSLTPALPRSIRHQTAKASPSGSARAPRPPITEIVTGRRKTFCRCCVISRVVRAGKVNYGKLRHFAVGNFFTILFQCKNTRRQPPKLHPHPAFPARIIPISHEIQPPRRALPRRSRNFPHLAGASRVWRRIIAVREMPRPAHRRGAARKRPSAPPDARRGAGRCRRYRARAPRQCRPADRCHSPRQSWPDAPRRRAPARFRSAAHAA